MFDWFDDHPAGMIFVIGMGLLVSYHISEMIWPVPRNSGCPEGQRQYADLVEQTNAKGGLTLKLNLVCREKEFNE